jgi:hypothetical protein
VEIEPLLFGRSRLEKYFINYLGTRELLRAWIYILGELSRTTPSGYQGLGVVVVSRVVRLVTCLPPSQSLTGQIGMNMANLIENQSSLPDQKIRIYYWANWTLKISRRCN